MVLVLGVVALVTVIAGVAAVLVLASRQAREQTTPASQPGDYVAPVSSGGYRWRHTDESLEDFQRRIARENAAGPASPGKT
ncbi:MAG TPA: hypothetical protein VIF15_07035 [Polyangiaceae bacterium]|jgi:hypothetical protein